MTTVASVASSSPSSPSPSSQDVISVDVTPNTLVEALQPSAAAQASPPSSTEPAPSSSSSFSPAKLLKLFTPPSIVTSSLPQSRSSESLASATSPSVEDPERPPRTLSTDSDHGSLFDATRAQYALNTSAVTSPSQTKPDRKLSFASSLVTLLRPSTATEMHSPTIRDRFKRGHLTAAICPTTEAENGYWICLVVDVMETESDCLVQLAHLLPLYPDKEPSGMSGSLYHCDTNQTFWEQEVRLLHVPVISETSSTGQQYFRIMSDVARIMARRNSGDDNSTSDESDIAARSRGAVAASFEKLQIYQLEDPLSLKSPAIPVDLPSYEEIMNKCDELVANVAHQVSLPEMDPTPSCPWKRIKQIDGIDVFKKSASGDHFHCFMARTFVQASPAEIKFLVKHSRNRQRYDPFCKSTRLVQTIDDSTIIVHFTDRKFLIDRDFCIMRHDRTTSDGTVILASNSIKTPKCPLTDCVRAKVVDSGFCLAPRGKGACLMTYVIQVNLRGWLPSALVDYVMDQQVYRVLLGIRHHFQTVGATTTPSTPLSPSQPQPPTPFPQSPLES